MPRTKGTKNNEVIGYYIPKTKYSFSDEQIKLIEDYHYYIFQYLRYSRLDYRQYYDIVVFGFLLGIQEHDPNMPNLKGYLRIHMRRAVAWHKKYMNVNSRSALNEYVPLIVDSEENDTFSSYDVDKFDLGQHIETRLLFDKMMSGDCFNPIQTAFVKYIVYGYSGQEAMHKISKKTKIRHSEIKNQIQTMRIMLKSYIRYGI